MINKIVLFPKNPGARIYELQAELMVTLPEHIPPLGILIDKTVGTVGYWRNFLDIATCWAIFLGYHYPDIHFYLGLRWELLKNF